MLDSTYLRNHADALANEHRRDGDDDGIDERRSVRPRWSVQEGRQYPGSTFYHDASETEGGEDSGQGIG